MNSATIDRAKDEIEFLRVMLDAPPLLMAQEERDWIVARIEELNEVIADA